MSWLKDACGVAGGTNTHTGNSGKGCQRQRVLRRLPSSYRCCEWLWDLASSCTLRFLRWKVVGAILRSPCSESLIIHSIWRFRPPSFLSLVSARPPNYEGAGGEKGNAIRLVGFAWLSLGLDHYLEKVKNIVSNQFILFFEIDSNSLPKPGRTTLSIIEPAIEQALSIDPEGWL